MCTLRDSISKLGGLSAQVVGISVNDPWTLKGFTEKNGLTFPLLSDYNRSTIASYGVELPDFAGLKGYTVAQRSVFIVDRNGLIKYQWVAPQPGVEPDYQALEEELAVVK
jgi:peroxiredoxin